MSHQTDHQIEAPALLLRGFPAMSSRGFLGWSSVVLLRHRGHVILVDTGGPGDRPALLTGLAKHGLEPGDVDMLVLSHLHFDHAANVELFASAEVFLHRSELAYARDPAPGDLAISGWLAAAIARHPRLELLDGEPELLEGIRVMRTPGHTLGSISLALTVAGETWILAQDAVKNRRELATGRVEMAADPDLARGSLERIRSAARVVVPGHDAPLRIDGERLLPLGETRVEVTEILSGRRVLLTTEGEGS